MAKVNWNSKSALKKNQDLLKERVINLGFAIEADAKKNCRDLGIVDTDRLRASISTNWTGSGQIEGKINAKAKTGDGIKQPMNLEGDFSVAVGTNVEYACILGCHASIKMWDVKKNKVFLKTIGQIKVGDYVISQNGLPHEVVNTNRFDAKLKPELIEIEAEWRNGKNHKLILTTDHKILTSKNGTNCWVQAGDMIVGDMVFSPIKIPHNKNISIESRVCELCGKSFNEKRSIKRSTCSKKCGDILRASSHKGMRRSEAAKDKMKNASLKRFLSNPDSHPNRIMAKKGFTTYPEKQIADYLDKNGIGFQRQYKVGRHFIDFAIPDGKLFIEADGAYWHQDQNKDIERDKVIKKAYPDWRIYHFHFVDRRFSKNINPNPLEGVHYLQCNNSMGSYANPEYFKMVKIVGIRRFQYAQKGDKPTMLFDLSIDGVHSFIANGVVVSNSYHEYGTKKIAARPYLRPAYRKNIKKFMQGLKK